MAGRGWMARVEAASRRLRVCWMRRLPPGLGWAGHRDSQQSRNQRRARGWRPVTGGLARCLCLSGRIWRRYQTGGIELSKPFPVPGARQAESHLPPSRSHLPKQDSSPHSFDTLGCSQIRQNRLKNPWDLHPASDLRSGGRRHSAGSSHGPWSCALLLLGAQDETGCNSALGASRLLHSRFPPLRMGNGRRAMGDGRWAMSDGWPCQVCPLPLLLHHARRHPEGPRACRAPCAAVPQHNPRLPYRVTIPNLAMDNKTK